MNRLHAHIASTESYLRLLKAADECVRLHEAAGVDIPSVLNIFTHPELAAVRPRREPKEDEGEENENLFTPSPLPMPPSPHRPEIVPPSWIYIPVSESTPTSLGLAFIRNHMGPVTSSEIASYVRGLLPNAAINSIYNAMNRVAGNGILKKTDDGFELLKPEAAGIVNADYLWAPADQLLPTETSWFRRHALIHALREDPQTQIGRIAARLAASDWLPIDSNKDSLKLDLQALERQKVARRVNGGRRWELCPETEAEDQQQTPP